MIALLPFPDINPELFAIDIFGIHLAIRWYALAYIAGLVLAWRWIVHLTKRPTLWKDDTPAMQPLQVEDLLTWVIFGVILGGRLGFVLFYQPGYYLANPSEILRIWEGGMSFHGGFLGVVVAGLIYSYRNGLSPWSVGDAMACSVPIGLALGRIANFINAELWGRPSSAPWAVNFPGINAQTCPIWWLDPVCSRHPSQLYEAGLEGVLLFVVMTWLILRRGWLKKPGQMIGVFLIGYGLARTLVENFRQTDAQFITPNNPLGHVIRFGDTLGTWGLTMGQILSLPMIAVGVVVLLYAQFNARRGA